MKVLLTILVVLASQITNCQTWVISGIDTVRASFEVSSLRYEYAKKIVKQGYVVRLTISYSGDKMPCATDDSDCDYADKHKVVAYLDMRKKEIDETKWHVWDAERNKPE